MASANILAAPPAGPQEAVPFGSQEPFSVLHEETDAAADLRGDGEEGAGEDLAPPASPAPAPTPPPEVRIKTGAVLCPGERTFSGGLATHFHVFCALDDDGFLSW